MSDLTGTRLVFVVAQKHFERQGGVVTSFSTLHPVSDLEGLPCAAEDFPNCGLVWWPMKAQGVQFGEPGRLVVGKLEHAFKWEPDKETSHRYQVEPESVHPVATHEAVEIFSIGEMGFESPGDFLQPVFPLRVGHPPSGVVLLRWQGRIVGPFSLRDTKYEGGVYLANLSPEREETVWIVDELVFRKEFDSRTLYERTDVSLVPRSRTETGAILRQDSFEIVLAGNLSRFREISDTSWKHVSADEVVRRTAKRILTRKQFQEFRKLLEQVASLSEAPELGAEESLAIAELTKNAQRRIDSIENLAKAIVDSGVLDEELEGQRDREWANFVEKRASVLAAEIGERVKKERGELEDLTRQLSLARLELERQRTRGIEEVELEIQKLKAKAQEQLVGRERDVALREVALANASKSLEDVTRRFHEAKGEITQRLLELAPFFSTTFGAMPLDSKNVDSIGSSPATQASATLAFPSFVFDQSREPASHLAEEELLGRVSSLAMKAGLQYRSLDLVALHLSLKTSDLTVIGGASGTGKTSLAHLYSLALRGADPAGDGRFLEISVGPGWLDFRDILGAVNPIRKDFEPSESGLFRSICFAASEFRNRGSASGIYLVCLDEMNLAQVEHYLAPVLQGLSSPRRELRCFDADSLEPRSVYRDWSTLPLSRALRFVGTVNFDETTRQLSDRVLDRSNLLRLRPGNRAEIPVAATSFDGLACDGRAVRLEDFAAWTRERELPRDLGVVLDQMIPILESLGCSISHRSYRSICTFVGSSNGLCTEKEAFELQIILRVLPRIRNVFGLGSREAGARLCELFDEAGLHEASTFARESFAALGGE